MVEGHDQETGALSGRAPSGVAGACIYHASFVLNDGNQNRCINQRTIGDAIEKTPVTVRTARNILHEALDE